MSTEHGNLEPTREKFCFLKLLGHLLQSTEVFVPVRKNERRARGKEKGVREGSTKTKKRASRRNGTGEKERGKVLSRPG